MYITQNFKERLNTTLVQDNKIITEKQMTQIYTEDAKSVEVLNKLRAMYAKVKQSFKVTVFTDSELNRTRGDIRKWPHFNQINRIIDISTRPGTLVDKRTSVNSGGVNIKIVRGSSTDKYVNELKVIRDFMVSSTGIKAFKAGFAESDDLKIIAYNTLAYSLFLGVCDLLSAGLVLDENTQLQYRDKFDTEILKQVGLVADDIRSNRVLDMLRGRTDNILKEAEMVTTVIFAGLAFIILGRYCVKCWFRMRYVLSDFLKLQATFIESSALGNTNTTTRKKQEALAVKIIELAEKVDNERETHQASVKIDLRKEDAEMASNTSSEDDVFMLD